MSFVTDVLSTSYLFGFDDLSEGNVENDELNKEEYELLISKFFKDLEIIAKNEENYKKSIEYLNSLGELDLLKDVSLIDNENYDDVGLTIENLIKKNKNILTEEFVSKMIDESKDYIRSIDPKLVDEARVANISELTSDSKVIVSFFNLILKFFVNLIYDIKINLYRRQVASLKNKIQLLVKINELILENKFFDCSEEDSASERDEEEDELSTTTDDIDSIISEDEFFDCSSLLEDIVEEIEDNDIPNCSISNESTQIKNILQTFIYDFLPFHGITIEQDPDDEYLQHGRFFTRGDMASGISLTEDDVSANGFPGIIDLKLTCDSNIDLDIQIIPEETLFIDLSRSIGQQFSLFMNIKKSSIRHFCSCFGDSNNKLSWLALGWCERLVKSWVGSKKSIAFSLNIKEIEVDLKNKEVKLVSSIDSSLNAKDFDEDIHVLRQLPFVSEITLMFSLEEFQETFKNYRW